MVNLPGLAGTSAAGRCLVMGVVNVTPDSFSDGGAWLDPAVAVARGERLAAEGADIVDVGGESTRPGAQRVDQAGELRRIGPVVSELAAAGVLVSGTMPIAWSFSRTSGDSMILTVSRLSLSITAAGVLAGATMPNHPGTSYPG